MKPDKKNLDITVTTTPCAVYNLWMQGCNNQPSQLALLQLTQTVTEAEPSQHIPELYTLTATCVSRPGTLPGVSEVGGEGFFFRNLPVI